MLIEFLHETVNVLLVKSRNFMYIFCKLFLDRLDVILSYFEEPGALYSTIISVGTQ